MTPPDRDLQLTNIILYFFGRGGGSAERHGGRWLEKLVIVPAQPLTESRVGAELGKKTIYLKVFMVIKVFYKKIG